jgi:hypothetical protein
MARDVTFFKPWMCVRCGYLMDCTDTADGSHEAPKQGDISLCLNCGARYALRGDAWSLMTAAEFSSLTPQERCELTMAELARTRASLPDLAKRGGRA